MRINLTPTEQRVLSALQWSTKPIQVNDLAVYARLDPDKVSVAWIRSVVNRLRSRCPDYVFIRMSGPKYSVNALTASRQDLTIQMRPRRRRIAALKKVMP
jgi:hypothetical protein